MNPWLVRTIMAVLALEAGVCVAFLADDWAPLRQKEDALFRTVLSAARENEEFVLDEAEPVSRVRLVRPLKEGAVRPYFHVKVDEETTRELDSYPLSPTDWRELLIHMDEVGCRVAAIEQPLSWQGDDLFHLGRLASLYSALSLFETVVLTVDLRRAPTAQPIPEYLKRNAIPIENVQGDPGALIRVNRVLHDASATSSENALYSFRVQESEEDANPALVRWGDHLIPSFPLAVAMAQHKISPEEVTIDLGRHMRLGDGPIIPIDEFGQLTIPLIDQPAQGELEAWEASLPSQVTATRESAPTEEIPRCALFADSSSDSPAPWENHHHLQRIISSFDVLPRPDSAKPHTRLTMGMEIAFMALIAIVAALLIRMRTLFRNLTFLILLLIVPTIAILLVVNSRQWTPFAPVLATALAGWILSCRMNRYLPARAPAAPVSD